jgi:hypothetical protein
MVAKPVDKNSILNEILSKLNRISGPDKQGWYTALCPFHNDRQHPNLRLTSIGFKCLRCQEKGSLNKLAEKLGIPVPQKKTSLGRIVDTYDYRDEKGTLLYQVVRYLPKAFKQRRPDDKGGWIWNLKEVRRILYQLPELLQTPLDVPIFLTEGEKDVKALRSLGLNASCNSEGAGKFTMDIREPLKGRPVVIIADKDEAGRKHAAQVAILLYKFAASVKLLELPGDKVKDAADWVQAGGTQEQLESLIAATPVWQPPQGAELLDDIVAFIRRFLVLSTHQAEIAALWIIHTYLFQLADVTPYLNIYSTEKRCGKTLLLEILEMLVQKPWLTGRVTPAVLARKVDAEQPTLLLDESDAAFKGDKEYAETLRGILNTGYRSGGKCSICVGQGASIGYKDLSTFCPKAIAGIGKLPDTVADRSLPIVLKRRTKDELVEKFRRRKVKPLAEVLRSRIVALSEILAQIIEGAEAAIPPQLNDRAADCVEPLLAIADAAGKDWPDRARQAVVALLCKGEAADDSLGVRLLADIQEILSEDGPQIPSTELVNKLRAKEEAPWGDLYGKPLGVIQLAALLRPYDIHPGTIRIETGTPKGYKREDFLDAWRRYLPNTDFQAATPPHSGTSQPQNIGIENPPQLPLKEPNVADDSQPQPEANVADVADQKSDKGLKPDNSHSDPPPSETSISQSNNQIKKENEPGWEAEL